MKLLNQIIIALAAAFALAAITPQPYAQGGVPLWTNRYDGRGNGDDFAHAVAVDGNGNVFVTGQSDGGSSHNEYATIKYSSDGVELWANRYSGPTGSGSSDDRASAVAVDNDGNVFVTGGSEGPTGSGDFATVAYSGDGVPLWTNRYDGLGNGGDHAWGVAVDNNGNVLVAGVSVG